MNQPLTDVPLGNFVGGAFRAHAYIMEASSSQVPCTLPQSLGIEIPQSVPLCVSVSPNGKTQRRITKVDRATQTPVFTKAICCSVWMTGTHPDTYRTKDFPIDKQECVLFGIVNVEIFIHSGHSTELRGNLTSFELRFKFRAVSLSNEVCKVAKNR